MKDKHFIWIIPMILIIGFVLGYISGLHIPKDIKIGLDDETLKVYDKMLNIYNLSANCTENLQKQDLNTASCDFNGVDSQKYSCCEAKYKVTFFNSSNWLCEEDVWKEERFK